MTETGVNSINTTALAFIGDAVYEVFIRNRVLCKYGQNADRLHREAVRYVKADAQAEVVRRLTEEGRGGLSHRRGGESGQESEKPQNKVKGERRKPNGL